MAAPSSVTNKCFHLTEAELKFCTADDKQRAEIILPIHNAIEEAAYRAFAESLLLWELRAIASLRKHPERFWPISKKSLT